MSLSRVMYILLFFVICWSAYYLLDNYDAADIQVTPNLELPMFSGDRISNISYDAQGVRNHIISAVHLDYYSRSGNTIFESPTLRIYGNGDQLEWEITAQRGILTKNKVLTLYDRVLAKNLLEDSSFDKMSTARLSIQLGNRDFWTETSVQLNGAQFEITGQAMKGNFSNHSALLYNHVQGKYENIAP